LPLKLSELHPAIDRSDGHTERWSPRQSIGSATECSRFGSPKGYPSTGTLAWPMQKWRRHALVTFRLLSPAMKIVRVANFSNGSLHLVWKKGLAVPGFGV
jgi:hypothetical protein